MVFGLLIALALSFFLFMNGMMSNQEQNRAVETNRSEMIYAKNDKELIKSVQEKRDMYLQIYHVYPNSINDLISKGFLSDNFLETEFGKQISIVNGGIYFSTDDEMTGHFIQSNEDILKAKSYLNATIDLKKQRDTINQIISNDNSDSVIINYGDVVGKTNSKLGNLEVTNPRNKITNSESNILNGL